MKNLVEREPRLPLFVRVMTQPPLAECWSVNISKSGIGLIALATPDRGSPAEGSKLDAEFRLPDTSATVQARGTVAWRHEGPRGAEPGGTLSVGLLLESVADRGRRALTRYLEQYRFRVVAAWCSPAERAALARALGPEIDLHFAQTLDEIEQLVARGDIHVVLLCGANPSAAQATLSWAETRFAQTGSAQLVRPRDLAPRIVSSAEVPAALLVRYFNSGTLFRAVRSPHDVEELRLSVLAGCRDYGMRTELHRSGLALERALWRDRARSRPSSHLDRLAADRLIHASAAMARILDLARTVAPHRTSVLLQGETGTGKEVLAHVIHELGDRAHAAFVVQDCGTLTETLLESELFGHVKGAFTGAVADHDGLFVTADGGTIFLDEIENTSPNVQAKLLRAIETGEVRPVGGTETRHTDVRVIAASNRALEAEVAAGRFRADLYYRLDAFPICLPPLRERRADILPLARRFLVEACDAAGCEAKDLSDDVRALLENHSWPGNVRELRNVIERAVLLSPPEATEIIRDALPETLAAAPVPGSAVLQTLEAPLKTLVGRFEAEIIRETLMTHGGVVRAAAAALQIDEVTLWRKAKRHGLK